jgi:hypothetical protein
MANRFWVGGTGIWNNASTANWSATTGGAAGASAPTSVDTVTFDVNSGTGTCTTAAGSACSSMTLNTQNIALVLGANHTTTSSFILTQGSINLAGFVLNCTVLSSSNTNTRSIAFGSTGQINLTSTTGTLWTTSASTGFTTTGTNKTVVAPNGAAGTRTFNFGALAETVAMSVSVTAGTDTVSLQGRYYTLNTTGFTGTIGAASRSIYGSLIIGAGATYTSTTTVTSFIGTSGSHTITTNGVTIDGAITFDGLGGTWTFADALTQGAGKNFIFTNGTVKLKISVTSTVGAFSTTGTTQKFLMSSVSGTQATLTQANGTVTATYLTIQDINVTGGATWLAYVTSNNVNGGNNTGWDFYLPASSIYDSLRLRGYTGTVTDMLLQYYKYNGATSNNIQDAELEYLILKGFTSGSNTDKWYAYLFSLGFIGTLTDMLFNYWKDPA